MILIGFGANLPSAYGSPPCTFQTLVASLLPDAGISVFDSSSLWHSAPVPESNQPWYFNAVLHVRTHQGPDGLLASLKALEEHIGRVQGVRNAARALDLDLLCYHDVVINELVLQLPHPRMHQRAFVLYPLYEVAPGWQHPVLKKSVEDLIAILPADQQIEKINDTEQGLLDEPKTHRRIAS